MARQTLTLDDLGKKFGNNQQKNSQRGDNKNFNNRNDRQGNNQRTNHSGNNSHHGKPKNSDRPLNNEKATAPYNFVSLPEKILPSEIESIAVDAFKSHIQNCEKISGEIELEIKTLTPLFIGGNGKNSFSPAGEDKFIIPGSSLRGMFKNIFKIVTCSAFRGGTKSQGKGEDFNDEHIYFRCLMAPSGSPKWMEDLCATYKARMEGDKGKNARPGFLIKTDKNKYFIAPLKPNIERKNDFIMIKDFQNEYRPVKFKDSCVYWDLKKKRAYILTGNQWADTDRKPNNHENLLTREQYEKYRESLKGLTAEEIAKKNAELNYGKQIIRFVKLDYVDWSKRIELPDDVLKSYEHDRNRRGVNLFKDRGILHHEQLKKFFKDKLPDDVETLIPCHYLEEDGQVTAFGHGQCFRIPYKNSIGVAVPEELQNEKIIDFTDAVFGLKENWASRVAFEDATPISKIDTLETAAAHPLMQPNPTSYQLYLVQQDGENLTHWDKDRPKLRGYKLYWHNNTWNWKANPNERGDLTKELTPISRGEFKTKIRFQNLSEIELGALLMIFDLNGAKNPAYKIGMGKPFGFGSIQIEWRLFVENNDAYTKIFDSEGFKNPYKKIDATDYLDAFKNHIKKNEMLEVWQKIMDELNLILDWKNKPDSKKIKSMSGDVSQRDGVDIKFKNRVPLPNVSEVIK